MMSLAINITWGRGEGGFPAEFATTAQPSLIATGYRYPKHKCTLQTPFSHLSRKILARIVVPFVLGRGIYVV